MKKIIPKIERKLRFITGMNTPVCEKACSEPYCARVSCFIPIAPSTKRETCANCGGWVGYIKTVTHTTTLNKLKMIN